MAIREGCRRDELLEILSEFNTIEDCADFILRREREMAEKIKEVFAQPIDRINFPISKKRYTNFRNVVLSIIDEIIKEASDGKN